MPEVAANGITIHYEERGEGYPLILIMGFGADGSLWERHVDEYDKHFRCIMVDNRGVGKTDKPAGPYTTEMMADDVAGLMDALGIKNAHVAGISMGGAIAQNLALRHPEKVRALLLISTWAKFNKYAVSVYEHCKKMRRVSDLGDFMELIQLWIFAPDYFENNLETLREGQDAARRNNVPQPQHAFEGQLDACINHDTVDRLQEIGAPTLIVVGQQDIFTPLAFSELLHKKIPGSELYIIPGTGHACHWEALEEFNKLSTEFLLKH